MHVALWAEQALEQCRERRNREQQQAGFPRGIALREVLLRVRGGRPSGSAERCRGSDNRLASLQGCHGTAAGARAGAGIMDVMLSKQELMQVTPSAERHTLAILQGKKGRVRLCCERGRRAERCAQGR